MQNHACFSANLACSGVNPCPDCLEVLRSKVLPHAMAMGGFNGDPRQAGAFFQGFLEGWQRLHAEMASGTVMMHAGAKTFSVVDVTPMIESVALRRKQLEEQAALQAQEMARMQHLNAAAHIDNRVRGAAAGFENGGVSVEAASAGGAWTAGQGQGQELPLESSPEPLDDPEILRRVAMGEEVSAATQAVQLTKAMDAEEIAMAGAEIQPTLNGRLPKEEPSRPGVILGNVMTLPTENKEP